jgi:threonyl-tRNA synthetase
VPDYRITVDRRPLTVPAGTTAGEALAAGGAEGIAVRIDELRLADLSAVVGDGQHLESVPAGAPDGLDVVRHSAAHILAQAVLGLYPDARLGIGPPVENGFYYDFEVADPFTPDDVARIEERMREIVAADQPFVRRVVQREEADRLFAGQPYKREIIDRAARGAVSGEETVDAAGTEITVYDNLAGPGGQPVFTDLCRGPHLPSTGRLPAFRLTRTAAAYWRGDEHNAVLQRIYGTAWDSERSLAEYERMLAEAERRDHRRLGAELDLFSFPPEVGPGLAVFHPRGGVVRRVLEDYSRRRHEDAGYSFVYTPHITKQQLFETSGHLQSFAEGMYPPMHLEGVDYYLKPMNCPFHILVYRSRGRSYRELPLRLFEFGTVYRYEKSGVVHGLTRVRGLTMDDAHIFCAREQMAEELATLLRFVLDLLRDYGLTDFRLELSTRDDSPKFIGADEDWAAATAALEAAAAEQALELTPDPGGAAYYGPKISVQVRDAIGRNWQMSTIQVDFNLPRRFGLEYQAADNTRQLPVMIHRALFGSVERFFGILTEHYAGAFPAWLAPVQVACVPIAERHVDYLRGVAAELRRRGLRVEVDDSDERMQKKIAKAELDKIPFMLVAGDRDVAAGAVSMRYRGRGDDRRGVPLADAAAEIERVVAERLVDPGALAPAPPPAVR